MIEHLRTSSEIKLTWIRLTPDVAFGIVTKYTIFYKTETKIAKTHGTTISNGILIVHGSSTQAVIDKLDPDFSYRLRISASTSVGEGKLSEPIIVEGEIVFRIMLLFSSFLWDYFMPSSW